MVNATVYEIIYSTSGLDGYLITFNYSAWDGSTSYSNVGDVTIPYDTQTHKITRLVREAAADKIYSDNSVTVDPEDILILGSF